MSPSKIKLFYNHIFLKHKEIIIIIDLVKEIIQYSIHLIKFKIQILLLAHLRINTKKIELLFSLHLRSSKQNDFKGALSLIKFGNCFSELTRVSHESEWCGNPLSVDLGHPSLFLV
jgi:hypothetical protein